MEHERLVRSAHGVSQNTFHLIWVTKYRYPTFGNQSLKEVCWYAIDSACRRYGIVVHELEVMADHVHLFARLPRTMSVSEAFQLLKGFSSRCFRRACPWMGKYKALWSGFTFSRTVGSVTGGVIKQYIKETNVHGKFGKQSGQIKLNRFGREGRKVLLPSGRRAARTA